MHAMDATSGETISHVILNISMFCIFQSNAGDKLLYPRRACPFASNNSDQVRGHKSNSDTQATDETSDNTLVDSQGACPSAINIGDQVQGHKWNSDMHEHIATIRAQTPKPISVAKKLRDFAKECCEKGDLKRAKIAEFTAAAVKNPNPFDSKNHHLDDATLLCIKWR